MPTRHPLTESRPLAEAATSLESGRYRIQVITPGWGSSGYYSSEALADAAQRRVFPAGTHMYLDHPTPTEEEERPARSVRDLAAVLSTDATIDPATGGLVAEARVFGPYRPLLDELADDIGVSIRAAATASLGEAEGRRGWVIDRLDEGLSVDFVTHAGRGGRVLELIESARATVDEAGSIGQWLESRLHLALTQFGDDLYGDGRLTRNERITLSSAIGDGLQAWTSRVEAEAPQLFRRGVWDDPVTAEAGTTSQTTATEAEEPPAGLAPPAPTPQETVEESMPELTEAEERELREAAGRVPTLTTENQLLRAQIAAGPIADRLLTESDLPAAAHPAVRTQVLVTVPLTEAGALDEAAFTIAVNAAVEAKRTEVAAIAEALGAGKPRGLGNTQTGSDTKQMTEAEFNTILGIKTGD